jgi:hypothetical protein
LECDRLIIITAFWLVCALSVSATALFSVIVVALVTVASGSACLVGSWTFGHDVNAFLYK